MPPVTSSPVVGSRGICPAVNTRFPATVACEYGPMAAGALSVLIIFFLVIIIFLFPDFNTITIDCTS